MKKSIFFVSILCVFAFSNAFSQEVDADYQEALKAYKEKDFKESFRGFSKLYISNLSDGKLNFYLGRSAYEIGEYDIALSAFERVEMLESGNVRNKLELARTYFMLKMYEDSELKFKEVLENPSLPKNVRTNVELYLSKVTKVQKRSYTYASISLDALYDSNVNYGSLDDFDTVIGRLPSVKEEDDMAMQLNASVVNIYDIGESNGFAIKNVINMYSKEYLSSNDYGINYIGYTPSIVYKETQYLAELAFGFDALYLGRELYQTSVSISPRIEYGHSNTLKSIAYYKYQENYNWIAGQLDADHYELAYSLQSILSPRSYIQANVVGVMERRSGSGASPYVNFDEYKLSAVYANQLDNTYSVELFGEYKGRYYEDRSSIFGTVRVDNGIIVSGKVYMKVMDTLRAYIGGSYNKVDSNHERYTYDKYTATAGINKTF